MKLLFRDISAKDGTGKVKIVPEEPEDMWHIYNLVMTGDLVRTTTFRKVVKQTVTGSTSSNKIRLNLTIEVERVQFDPDTCVLRLSGKNREETEHVKLGAYHTLDLELNRSFEFEKSCWDTVLLERLEQACDPAQHAEVGAVVMQPGLANVCLVTSCMTIVRQRIEMTIPKKRAMNAQHDKAVQRFHRTIYEAILRHIKLDKIGVVLLAGPGHCHEDFFEYMKEEALTKDDKIITSNKSKFVLCHASSGFKHALEEVLAQPGIQSRLLDTKAVAEVQAMNDFLAMLSSQVGRAHYGFNHVKAAADSDAVETLLMSDSVFRIRDFVARRKYVDLVEQVQSKGGKFFCLSSLHVTGEQLHQLGGVAAILRFPLEIDTAEEENHDLDGMEAGIGHVDEEAEGVTAGTDASDMGL